MPIQCLAEIKQEADLQLLPVIMLSSVIKEKETEQLYTTCARYYIQKPNSYLTKIVEQVLYLSKEKNRRQKKTLFFFQYLIPIRNC